MPDCSVLSILWLREIEQADRRRRRTQGSASVAKGGEGVERKGETATERKGWERESETRGRDEHGGRVE